MLDADAGLAHIMQRGLLQRSDRSVEVFFYKQKANADPLPAAYNTVSSHPSLRHGAFRL